jgi:fibronectin-binding autotransporter adhesin
VFDGLAFADAMLAPSPTALPTSVVAPVPWSGLAAGMQGTWSDASASFFALPLAGDGQLAGASAGLLAAAHGSSAPLAFDASSGQLAIREVGGAHTVRESITSGGFVDVTLNGQEHSSNPRSASFDGTLAGATRRTFTSIQFAGGSQDTLTLAAQQVAGGLAVQATGATVVTQNVVATGSLAIQAPSITVNGSLQGSGVSLAASGWVMVNATGSIESVSAGSKGGIGIVAEVFVNSGQLHADGPVGGAITVQARNILNAGPITADSTGPGAPAGQVGITFTGAYVATAAAMMSASSASGPGGQLTIEGGSNSHLFTSGRQLATGSVGGAVALFGQDVVLDGATVDASGATGGAVTSSGTQFYANPNDTTRVTGNLNAGDSAIQFNDAVVVSDGVTVTAGANAVQFVGSGTQTLQGGSNTNWGNVNHTATGTLQLTNSLNITGSLITAAGTFDANNQPVIVSAGVAAVLGGQHLAGTAPQTFADGPVITGGQFSSSTGPMQVSGGIRLLGGVLGGVGTVDTVTAAGGTIVPGNNGVGVLRVSGALQLQPSATLRMLINGPEAGAGYSPLQAGGPIDLGQSTLGLQFGFTPPVGNSFEILTNTSGAPIIGTFAGLGEGAAFSQGGYQFQITYQGGSGGHSVVLTRLA